jgi:hypothetical protein
VWPAFIVVTPPTGDLSAGVLQVDEPVRIQAFISKSAVERLDMAVLRGLARFNVPQQNMMFLAPGVH